MKTQILSAFFVMNLLLSAGFAPLVIPAFQGEAYAQAKAPSYIKGGDNIENRIVAKGKTGTELLSIFAVMVGTAALIAGGIKLGMNNKQGGKELIIGGASCLLIVAMTYGIANLLIK